MTDMTMEENAQSHIAQNYIVVHCRPGCPKAARSWRDLNERLRPALEGLAIEQKLKEKFPRILYHQVPKIGISACPNGCSQPQIRDIGVMGFAKPRFEPELCTDCRICAGVCLENVISFESGSFSLDSGTCLGCGDCIRSCPSGALSAAESGWKLLQGGRVGRHPRFGELSGQVATDEEALSWILAVLRQYFDDSGPEERLSHYLEHHLIKP
ncbi:sulfite reductase (NADPH) [Acididesulfobacillus acetoxydans]|uniref:Dissimilatory sulfite reductase (Desulfoviridin), alpha/beta subunit n=1 Tax=Acididesulfobacillus acetoxydans TaxID=1561005 RepID=A0A8S0W8K8_9FIRM|nr:4Fe-4S dicluster domain-containing protein [Acididesulfobacillus acetoxydans]CAA7601889.1 sulfite reductase (NADPH) [Acididesulfobacillus acetoxydans]CEJ08267.1 Dissimilatory sulfite reductase (Desulfoviridin), alpha/beta subunit [Acididesulfobacillus acetoxydans]